MLLVILNHCLPVSWRWVLPTTAHKTRIRYCGGDVIFFICQIQAIRRYIKNYLETFFLSSEAERRKMPGHHKSDVTTQWNSPPKNFGRLNTQKPFPLCNLFRNILEIISRELWDSQRVKRIIPFFNWVWNFFFNYNSRMHLLKTCKISRNKFISVMNVWNEYVYNLVIILQGDKFSVIANVATERLR